MENQDQNAPGAPGKSGTWTSSSKSGIGKSLSASSRVSFTIGKGILNEVYYPKEDTACIRDMGFLITDGKGFFSDEKKDTKHETKMTENGIPAFQIKNTCKDKKYTIEREVISDPLRNTVLQKIKFTALKGDKNSYKIYVLLAPHISNQSAGNTGWLQDYKGVPMLFAKRDDITLALACSLPWKKRSVGFVGTSDGFTDISSHNNMEWEYAKAENGNITLTAEIDLEESDEFTLALSFGKDVDEAALHARASLLLGFELIKKQYVKQWDNWHTAIHENKPDDIEGGKLFRNSVAVMRMHESNHYPGAVIASSSIPWGNTKGDGDIGGYHLVWPRDLVECSGGFLAFNAKEDAMRVLNYVMATQEEDGHWSQNMWLEGKSYWKGLQLDETAFPILLISSCLQVDILNDELKKNAWKTVKKAATFLLNYGPLSPQERWEEESGISVSTLPTCIAALLAAADFAEANNAQDFAKYCRQTADYWNSRIEDWLYVTDTPLAKKVGVDGYFIRINPHGVMAKDLEGEIIGLKNRPDDKKNMPVNELVSVDALCLVRFGLRSANDPKILNTVKVLDAILKTDTPYGPCWHRYNNDGYGEHADGSAFDGTGIGRAWPLLTGERAHYEIAAGNFKKASALRKTMEDFSSHELFSEQIWDTDDIPEKDLFFGRHSGSAIPLVWAHAEYVKLCASISKNKIVDMPEHTVKRYIKQQTKPDVNIWRFMLPCPHVIKGDTLRIETKAATKVHWSANNWETTQETESKDTGFGMFYTDIQVSAGKQLDFTFFWTASQNWENKNYSLAII